MNEKNDLSGPPFPAEIEAAAVHWLGVRDAGNMTPGQEAEFAAWCEADDRHAAAFAAIDRMWDEFDSLRRVIPTTGEPNPDLLAASVTPVVFRQRKSWRRFVPVSLAAAAAIAIGCATWWQSTAPALLTKTAATHIGGQSTMNLPDGSKVRLNTDTAVEVQFAAGERRVRLVRGEAHFTVAKDRSRPFIVNIGAVSVRAVGTAFNVRMDSAVVEVLVTEGKVRVDDALSGNSLLPSIGSADRSEGPTEALLVAGKRVLIEVNPAVVRSALSAPPAVAEVTPAEITRALAWREGRLEFEDSPLAQVIAEFNRYNAHKLVIDDPRLVEQRFGGKFRPDGCEALVRLLESSFGVQVERRESETVLRLPASSSGSAR